MLLSLQVADFNLSRVMEASSVASSVAATNPRWVAPEVLAGGSHAPASDVYAFGIILWEILTWQIPWDDLGPWQVTFCPQLACSLILSEQRLASHGVHMLKSLEGEMMTCQNHKDDFDSWQLAA